MSEKEIQIGEEFLNIIKESMSVGISEGVAKGIAIIDSRREEKRKNRADARLHNTEVLLKNYNNFRQHIEKSISSSEELEEDERNYNTFDFDEPLDETYVKSIIKSKTRTNIILKQIDFFLEYYNFKCLSSNREEIQRRGMVIKLLYTNEETMSFEDAAAELFVSTKTINRDRKAAIRELSALFFGIDGIKLY